MGKLLDALKQKNIDLNRSGGYREKYVQDQAKDLLVKMFNKLPETKRYELLNEYLSPKAKEKITEDGFMAMTHRVKAQGKEASLKFLTNNDSFGRPWRELLPLMEDRLAGWVDEEYKNQGVSRRSKDEEKLNALFRCQTFEIRKNYLWELVDDKRKPRYRRQFLTEATEDPVGSARFLSEEGTLAEGKDWEKFADAIEASLNEASLKEAQESIRSFKQPEHKELVGELFGKVGGLDFNNDRQCFMLQNAMLSSEEELEPYDLTEKARKRGWRKELDPVKKARQLKEEDKLDLGAIVDRSRKIINETEFPLDKQMCREAALQNYRNLSRMIPAGQRASKAYQEMSSHAAELQTLMVKEKYPRNKKTVNEGRALMTEQVAILEKEKDGIFLSKRNSPEHELMTKSLRLFNAKLDLTLENKTSQNLSAEELETVKNSDIKELFDKAKQASFNYSCLKTKYGKSGIIHDDGKARNKAARNAVDILNQVGTLMGLEDRATKMKDETALKVLRNRGSSDWEKKNAVDCAAKTIYALSLTHGGMPDEKQNSKLSEENLTKHLDEIKKRPEFKQMVRDLGPAGLCDAIVKGGDAVTVAYAKALEKVKAPQAGKNKASVEMTSEERHEFWAQQQKQPKQQQSETEPKFPTA